MIKQTKSRELAVQFVTLRNEYYVPGVYPVLDLRCVEITKAIDTFAKHIATQAKAEGVVEMQERCVEVCKQVGGIGGGNPARVTIEIEVTNECAEAIRNLKVEDKS